MIRVTDRITRILGVLAALTLGVLLIAGRPPAPDTRATFAASAPAAMLGAVEAPASAPTTPTTFAALPADTRTGIVSAMRAAQPISDSTALLLHDRTQQLAATVGEAETMISGRDGARVRFSEAALGRDAELHPLTGVVPLGLHTPQVRLSRSTGATAVEEWWRNSPAGIEQGFTLHARPEGTGPLRLQQTITSTLTAHLTDGDTALRFSDGESERLRFGGLIAYDATGRSLPAVMRLTAHHLAFVVDDTDAVFPVVIDPTWTQQAYLKASNTGAGDLFGYSVAVAGDTIVVGAHGEDSNATGVGGNQADNNASGSGAAYVFTRTGVTWTQQAYLKASNTGGSDFFGLSVAVAGDTIVVGAYGEGSNATGVGGNQADDSATNAGAAYVFFGAAPAPTVTWFGNTGAGCCGSSLVTPTVYTVPLGRGRILRALAPSSAAINASDSIVVTGNVVNATTKGGEEYGSTGRITVPAGAVPGGASVVLQSVDSLRELSSAAPLPSGRIFAAASAQVLNTSQQPITDNFTKPVTIAITLPAAAVSGIAVADLQLRYWSGTEWVVVPSKVQAHADGSVTVSAEVLHFTVFAVTVPTAPATTGTFITAPSFGAGYLTLVVFNGGSVDQLEAAVRQAGASGAWVQDANGTFSVLIPGGPAPLREAFVRSFPKEFAPMTPILLVRSTP